MSPAQQRSRIEPWLAVALVAASAWPVACGGKGEASDPSSSTDTEPSTRGAHASCPWEPEELLAEVDVRAPALRDCNLGAGESTARDCFTGAVVSGEAAQFTTNNCTDCLILSTFVNLPNEGKFHLYREADSYGDSLRVVRVDSCTDIIPVLTSELGCATPSTIYDCSDPLPDPTAF